MAGRKRKTGERERNGRIKRQAKVEAYTPELIAQRCRMVPPEYARSAEAGQALGQLMLAGHIQWREAEAGKTLRQAWLAFRGIAGIPPRTVTDRERGPSRGDPAWVDYEIALQNYNKLLAVALSGTDRKTQGMRILDDLCFQDTLPLEFLPPLARHHAPLLRGMLKSLADHLRITERSVNRNGFMGTRHDVSA